MRSKPRHPVRSDQQILAHPEDMELLHAVAAGEIVRGDPPGSTSTMAPHLWNGVPVRMRLRRLRDDELIHLPISGPPRLDERGRAVLGLLDGAAP